MLPEIAGEIADAQGAVGRGIVVVRADELGERIGVPPGPALVLLEDGGLVGAGVVEHGEEEVGMGGDVLGAVVDDAAEHGDALVFLAAFVEAAAETEGGFEHGRIDLEGLAQEGDGLSDEALPLEGDGEIEVGAGVGGAEGEDAAEDVFGFIHAAEPEEGAAEIFEGGGVVGLDGEGLLNQVDGFIKAAGAGAELTEEVEGFVGAWTEFEDAAVEGFGLGGSAGLKSLPALLEEELILVAFAGGHF